jgi:gluconokinase
MAAGQPLDDADRAPWLARVADEIARAGAAGAVVTCSALKRAYRDRLRAAGPALRFVLPHVAPDALARRVAARAPAHFMPASLVASQLAALEPAGPGEDLLRVDGEAPTARQVEAVLSGARIRATRP